MPLEIDVSYILPEPGMVDTKFERKIVKRMKKIGYGYSSAGYNYIDKERRIKFYLLTGLETK